MNPDSSTIETIIQPRTGWLPLELKELWRYRELAYYLAWRDVKVRYKQTVLGAAWAVIQPLMMMVVFTIFFRRLSPQSTLPYPLVVYAALLPWQYFSYCVSHGSQSLISSSNLISKVYFPRLLIPLATTGVGIVDLFVSSLLLVTLMIWYQVVPPTAIVLLPGLLLGLFLVSLGVAALLSSLAVTYRDVRYIVPFLVQIWLFSCPVAYPLDNIAPKWRLAYSMNPMAGIIGGMRASLLGETLDVGSVAVSLISSVMFFLVGIFYFRRVEKNFADVI